MEGKGVACLESESGGHRVQRIPHNERRGRVHSSTVTVAVLTPGQQAPDAFRQRETSDFQVSFFSGTGPGGQNRNKVQASARITHLPTGLVRTAQTRSRENSVRLAMEALMLDLDQGGERSLEQDRREQRRDQMGSGERGDKRRTYRFQDDQVQDHQTGKRARASKVMAGHFEALWAVTGTQAA